MSAHIAHRYRQLPAENKVCLVLVQKQMGLGFDVALGLCAHMIGQEPDFFSSLSEIQREDVEKIIKRTGAKIPS